MAFKSLIVLLGLLCVWMLYRLLCGLIKGDLVFAPFAKRHRGRRSILALLGASGIIALAWSAAQPYLFISSIFPGDASRAAYATLVLCFLVILGALFPKRKV